ncbi:MAG: F-type H+-transporting ATPase subunit epsilon [Thermomicrobiales bacterium]|jgi:F-type H+-transporting ATPase subunit epsilon|nr:F-type H+-transporting ATPase subunit epsilon [Thermomicrobiales bacterium]MEA2528856.1 F-type H+-transporting ATPase subunit epsilon [Thermomicrobiales bacterium]
MAKLQVEIVTGERVVFTENDVDMVVAPGSDGTLGILPRHAPLITTLAAGELRVKKGAREQSIVVFGGFMEVTPEKVVVLADTAERAEEIDVGRAEESRNRAQAEIGKRASNIDLAQAEADLRRATLRLQIGQRRAGRRRGPGMGEGGDNEL